MVKPSLLTKHISFFNYFKFHHIAKYILHIEIFVICISFVSIGVNVLMTMGDSCYRCVHPNKQLFSIVKFFFLLISTYPLVTLVNFHLTTLFEC